MIFQVNDSTNTTPYIIVQDDARFGVKILEETSQETTITFEEVCTSAKTPVGSVFNDPQTNKNYQVVGSKIIDAQNWIIRDNACILFGMWHGKLSFIDINRECPYKEFNFKKYYNWLDSVNFIPFCGVYCHGKVPLFTSSDFIYFARASRVENPNLKGAEDIVQNIDSFYQSVSPKLIDFDRAHYECTFENCTDRKVTFHCVCGECNTYEAVTDEEGKCQLSFSSKGLTKVLCFMNTKCVGEILEVF